MKKKIKPVVFANAEPAFAAAYPVLEAKDIKREWLEQNIKDMTADTKRILETCPIEHLQSKMHGRGYISKCPGIRAFMNTGYIITTPCDFVIETNGDGATFKHTSLGPKSSNSFHVGVHPKSQLHDYSAVPLNTLKDIIKISTGWHIIPNENYVFLVTPPHYGNESRFSGPVGIHDPYSDPQVNIFLFWHIMKGREVVSAGTPIAQYIPIPREFVTPPLITKAATNQEMKSFISMSNCVHMGKERIVSRQKRVAKELFKDIKY
jgi:hypothetical protein